jgi:hypothetical protein
MIGARGPADDAPTAEIESCSHVVIAARWLLAELPHNQNATARAIAVFLVIHSLRFGFSHLISLALLSYCPDVRATRGRRAPKSFVCLTGQPFYTPVRNSPVRQGAQ